MPLTVLHLSASPVGGAALRLVRTLCALAGVEARLVEPSRAGGSYEQDLVHADDPARTVELAEKADVLHLHNYVGLDSAHFAPLDLRALAAKGKAMVRQFHSNPALVASKTGRSVAALLACPLPRLVVAQYQERFYPTARVVPNIIPAVPPPPAGTEMRWDVLFCPTSKRWAWRKRWDTKGYDHTLALLRKASRRTGARTRCVRKATQREAMEEKGRSRIILDEMVTGSYHQSGLEGLALGRPVLAFLDGRTERVLRELTGASWTPFVNVRLEEALEPLCRLVAHRDEAEAVGAAGRSWMDRYWSDRELVRHYEEVYGDLLQDPSRVTRQEGLRIDGPAQRFFALTLPDLCWEARRRRSSPLSRLLFPRPGFGEEG